MSTSSPSSSTICHQRALSLPQNANLNASIHHNNHQQQHLQPKSNKVFAIQPVHHRTRSLPLTEETAIDFSASSPPNFSQFSQPSNNSMESIIEDYHNMDFTNNNTSSSCRGGSSSILKHLSKLHASQNATTTCSSSTSPSQLRKKRQHIMTASLRSMYYSHHTCN